MPESYSLYIKNTPQIYPFLPVTTATTLDKLTIISHGILPQPPNSSALSTDEKSFCKTLLLSESPLMIFSLRGLKTQILNEVYKAFPSLNSWIPSFLPSLTSRPKLSNMAATNHT
jgi:hypothetical protein